MDINTQMPAMITVADIQFKNGGKCYSFDPGKLLLEAGQEVIIDTQRGLEFGICQRGNHNVLADQIVQPLRPVVRLADEHDRQRLRDNAEREKQAFASCEQFIQRMQLDMKLVRVESAFDNSKMLFFFTSDGRVDFRELVKELAAVYRTRIEMRQIGVRDEAKLLGGLGICGRPFCCSQFLDDFQPVSIKMAKTQSLSLNPTKISGTCGRLMCCLKYEQDAYEDLIKHSPRQGSLVDTVDGRGTVVDVSLMKQQVKVSLEDSSEAPKYYSVDDIAVLRDGKGKKTDPPIPADIAPISGDPSRRKRLQSSHPVEINEEALPEISYNSDRVEPKELREPKEPRRRRGGQNRQHEGEPKPKQEKQEKRSEKTVEMPTEGVFFGTAAPSANAERSQNNRNRRRRGGQNRHHEGEPKPKQEKQAEPKPEGGQTSTPNPNHRRRRRGHRGGGNKGGGAPKAE